MAKYAQSAELQDMAHIMEYSIFEHTEIDTIVIFYIM